MELYKNKKDVQPIGETGKHMCNKCISYHENMTTGENYYQRRGLR